MSFVHSLQEGKKFFCHLNLVFEGMMGVIGIVKGSERGLMNDFSSEREVGGFVRVKFIQLLYGGERQGGFGRGNVIFRFRWWRFFVTPAGVTIGESSTPGNMVVDIG